MKIAIFIPNLSRKCSGGAEIYALSIASALADKYDITIFTCANYTKGFNINSIYNKYGSPLFKTRFVNYMPTGHERLKEIADLALESMRHKISKEYDLFINVAQNRLKAPEGIPSIHIIHFPDRNFDKIYPSFVAKKLNERYADSYSLFLPNSEFTKLYFDVYWNKPSKMLYPPIKMNPITHDEFEKKDNIILAVDRLVRDKKVIEMINAFSKLKEQKHSDYKFIIIGEPNPKQMDYYKEIRAKIVGMPIELYSNIGIEELQSWYKRAKIFWHAKGCGVDDSDPFHMEHFGLVTVEAMINGCVPVVINKAGQKEIVENDSQGFKWDTLDEMIEQTIRLIENDSIRVEMAGNAIKRGCEFLMPSFAKKLNEIVSELLEEYKNENR